MIRALLDNYKKWSVLSGGNAFPAEPHASISADRGETAALEELARRRKTSQRLALLARIVLTCAGGAPVTAVPESWE
jgi:hypothetical protein